MGVFLVRLSWAPYFSSKSVYVIHLLVCIILIILSLVILLYHWKFNEHVAAMQILWWLPNLPLIEFEKYNPITRIMKFDYFYFIPELFYKVSFGFNFRLDGTIENMIAFKICVFPIIGFLLSCLVLKYEPESHNLSLHKTPEDSLLD